MKCRIKDLASTQQHQRRLDLQHLSLLSSLCWSCWSVSFLSPSSLLSLSCLLNSVVISLSLICSATFWSVLRCPPPSLSRSLLTSSSKEGPPTKYPPSPLSSISLQLFLSGGYLGFPSDILSVSLSISHSLPSLILSLFFSLYCCFFCLSSVLDLN